MEYVKVTFPTDRNVYIDGDFGGRTNTPLRIEAGTHEFNLGNYANYAPPSIEIDVKNTTVLAPMLIAFAKKSP